MQEGSSSQDFIVHKGFDLGTNLLIEVMIDPDTLSFYTRIKRYEEQPNYEKPSYFDLVVLGRELLDIKLGLKNTPDLLLDALGRMIDLMIIHEAHSE